MKRLRFLNAKIVGCILALALAQAVSAQDFSITLQPTSLTLIPNEGASLVVSLYPLDGFTNSVTLSAGTLPSGVTAQFSPQVVTLPGTSILTLSATTNATLGGFTLNVTGTGGGITNTTSSSVTVNFGLLPICTGAFSGKVTDTYTGLPVSNAIVEPYISENYVRTDSNGDYTLSGLSLNGNNVPTEYNIVAIAQGFWQSPETFADAVCDATNTLNLQIVPVEYGSVSGIVTYVGGAPAFQVPVSLGGGDSILTDSNGFYQFTNVSLSYTNAPITDVVQSGRIGFDWPSSSNVVVRANSNTIQNLVIVPVCDGSVTGQVIYGDTLLPATNVPVSIYGSQGMISVLTDTNGNYAFPDVPLQENGTLVNSGISSSANGYNPGGTNVTITNCGEAVVAPAIYLQPVPKQYVGSVTGHVYDSQTDLPILNATVFCYDVGGQTDSNGFYLVTNVYVGYNPTMGNGFGENVGATGYYPAVSNIVVYGNQTTTQDVYLLKALPGYLTGVLRNSATGEPLTNITVGIAVNGGSTMYYRTDTNGSYTSGPLYLTYPNAPTSVQVFSTPNGYYQAITNGAITANTTNVADLDLLPVCTGATIIGAVVDAANQKPITNAYLYVLNLSSFADTDTNGNFILTNVTVGNNNSPIQVTIEANAPGFVMQSKTVTIFCNATILTEFGAPATALGTIEGLVTNEITGLPLTNVFIGSEFGESTTTDSNGFYQLTQAPLGANNSSRTWNITAIPTNFNAQTLPVTVTSNGPATLNFGFGATPTALTVSATGAPDPVTLSNQLTYLVTLTNTVADATDVQLSDILPLGVIFVSAVITNSPGTPFGVPAISNNVITTTASEFGSNSAVTLAITVTPNVAGTLTNVASATSSTPDLDPTGKDRTATVITTVVAPPPPTELIVSVQATPATTTVGSNLLYTVTLTNTVASAANVELVDTLPPSVTFVSANVSNAPGGSFSAPVYSGGAVTTSAANFASNSAVVLFITVIPNTSGALTNVTTVTSATTNLAPGTVLSATVLSGAITPPQPTDLAISVQGTPSNVTVGGNLLYTVTLTNSAATASNTVVTDTLPPEVTFLSATVTNNPGGEFGAPVLSGSQVTITAPIFTSNSAVQLLISVTPNAAGKLTNTVSVTSLTRDVGTDHTAFVINTAIAPIVIPPYADLSVAMSGAPNPVLVSNQLTYLLRVTNFGPATASSVVLTDTLPANVTFGSAVVSQGAYSLIPAGLEWNIGALSNQGFASATVVIFPLVLGTISNGATVSIVPGTPAVTDTNLVNNTTNVFTTVTGATLTNLSIVTGAITFNPQTGLYEQTVQVNNLSGLTASAVRVAVLDLPAFLQLYNARGTTNGAPYVEYDQPVAPGGNVVFTLEYYDKTRATFASPTFAATVVVAVVVPSPSGTFLQLDTNSPFLSEGQLTIEFASVPGHTYVVQYSSDMETWQTATPPIVAQNTRTLWVDSGPPVTARPPGGLGQRFYRVVQTN